MMDDTCNYVWMAVVTNATRDRYGKTKKVIMDDYCKKNDKSTILMDPLFSMYLFWVMHG